MEYINRCDGGMNTIDERNWTYNTNIFISDDKDTIEVKNWKDKLVAVLQQVPSKTAHLRPVIELLVSATSPAKIYLIDHKELSGMAKYTGFLIVLPGSHNLDNKELEYSIDLAITKEYAVCCSLHKEANIMNGLHNGHPFYSLYCKPDNIIYDNKNKIYPITSKERIQEVKEKANITVSLFLNRAKQFYSAADMLHETTGTNIVLFLLHQAVEVTFRGAINGLLGVDKPTHNLRSLRKYAQRCVPQLSQILAEETSVDKELIDILDDAYIAARYKENYIFKAEAVPLLFIRVKSFLDAANLITLNY